MAGGGTDEIESVSERREFRFLDIRDIGFTQTLGIFGRRGSGKTTCVCNFLARMNLPRGIVMCGTPEAWGTYGEVGVPRSYIYDDFDEEALDRIMKFQAGLKFRVDQQYQSEVDDLEGKALLERRAAWEARMVRLQKRAEAERLSQKQLQVLFEREKADEEFENQQKVHMLRSYLRKRKPELQRPHCMFTVLDDLSSNPKAMRSKVLQRCMDNGRHHLMLLCVLCQYSMQFPSACRGALDWVVIFFDTLTPNIKRLYENYVGEFEDRHMFAEALSEAAKRNCCLVINKRARSPDVYDSVFLYQPEELWVSKRYFGDPNYAWVHEMFYDDDKFLQYAVGGNGATAKIRKPKQQPQGAAAAAAALAKIQPKSFSMETLEKRKGKGGGGGGKSKGGGGKGASVAAATAGPAVEDDYDSDQDVDVEVLLQEQQRRKVKESVTELRQKLKTLTEGLAK
jgi:hypothetical protein